MRGERFEARGAGGKLVGDAAGPRGAGTGGAGALPVLLVHGINMSRDVWREVAASLADERQVVTFDLRGHGESDREGPFGAEDYASDALAVMDHLGIARAHVAGTSFGGSVACALAVKAPERVASIAAFGSALAVEGLDVEGAVGALRQAGVRGFFAAFLPQASFAPGTDPALVERALDAASNGRDVETVIAVARTAFSADLRATSAAVRAPALVVTGELDATCPVAAGAEMAKVLRTQHHVVPGKGHVITLEDPETVSSMIRAHARANERN
jgi:3-oxoadipate enol-lactonase